MIRASQEHSLQDLDTEQMMEQIKDISKFPCVVHGTFMKFWPSIRTEGLKKMSRNHIHFATGYPQDQTAISGSCQVFIELYLEKATKDEMKFFLSSNGVMLSSSRHNRVISPKYFKKVINREGRALM